MKPLYFFIALLCAPSMVRGQQWERLSDLDWDGALLSLRTNPVILFSGNRRSTDGGATWEKMQYERMIPAGVHPSRDSTVYMSVDDSMYRSFDAGNTFHKTTIPWGMRRVFFDPLDTSHCFAQMKDQTGSWTYFYSDIFSSDGGSTWNANAFSEFHSDNLHSKINSIPHYYESRYAAIHPKGNFCLKQRWNFVDNGTGVPGVLNNFVKVGMNGPLGEMQRTQGYAKLGIIEGCVSDFGEFIFSPFNQDTVFLYTNDAAQLSLDTGRNWRTVYYVKGDNVWSMGFDASKHTLFLVSALQGILLSSDLGKTWSVTNLGLRSQTIRQVHVDHLWNVYARTDEGFYRWKDGPLIGIEPLVSSPSGIVLEQNHPNPFNPSTTIRYYLSTDQTAKIDVYDALGSHVASLADGWQLRGWHSVSFHASSIGTGVYYYVLKTEDTSVIRSMVYLR